MDETLEKIKQFADEAHGDQMRRYTNERYIVHPERVMNLVREYTEDLPMLAAALLHDVLEDTPVTEEEIHNFLVTVMDKQQADQAVKLVVELTDVYTKENEPRLNRKKRKGKEAERLGDVSSEAQTVKYADMIDNSIDITENDKDFAPLFIRENKHLLSFMDKGNPQLYERAEKTLISCMQQLGIS